MKKILILTTLIILSFSCGSKKVMSPEVFRGRMLTLMHGGGFTGNYTTYIILENGQLFKNTKRFTEPVEVSGLESNVVEQIFSNYDILNLDELNLSTPGNLTYSVILRDGEEKHTLEWAKGEKGTDKAELFYRNVMKQIKLNNPNENESDKVKKEKF